jgi:DDE domain
MPTTRHVTEHYANHAMEADHARLKARLGPMRALKRLASARTIAAGHASYRTCATATTRSPPTYRSLIASASPSTTSLYPSDRSESLANGSWHPPTAVTQQCPRRYVTGCDVLYRHLPTVGVPNYLHTTDSGGLLSVTDEPSGSTRISVDRVQAGLSTSARMDRSCALGDYAKVIEMPNCRGRPRVVTSVDCDAVRFRSS